MLTHADAALLIGDPALALSERAEEESAQKLRIFDLAELWHQHTGFGFVFALWMTRHSSMPINFADARDEGISHIDDIATNYASEIGLDKNAMKEYLSSNISYSPDESMQKGMKLYFELAHKNRLIESVRPPEFL